MRGCQCREQVFSKLCQTLYVLCHSKKKGCIVMSVNYREFTKQELEDEIEELEARLAMSLDVAKAMAQAHVLDSDKFQILCRIEDLQWLHSGSHEPC